MNSSEIQSLYEQNPDAALEIMMTNKQYMHDLHAAARRFLGRLASQELAKDCVQDTFIHLLHQKNEYKTSLRHRIYLYLRSRCWAEVAKHRKLKVAIRQFSEKTSDAKHFSFLSEEEPEEIQTAIERLSDTQKTLIYLYYYADYNKHEIAKILGVTDNAVVIGLKKAENQLRLSLGSEYAARFTTLETEVDEPH